MAYNLPSAKEREAFIRREAIKLGINPDIAVKVARSEGLKDGIWQSNVINPKGKRETSYGDFQMLTGGGLGDEFERTSGLQAEDPTNWQELNRFALQQAKTGGWSPWYGARGQGITGMMGINAGNDHPVMGDAPYPGFGTPALPKKPQGLIETIMAQFQPNPENKTGDTSSRANQMGGILSGLGQQQAPTPLPPMSPIQNSQYQPVDADVMFNYGAGSSTEEEEEEEKLKKLLAGMGG
jgi:hypothetical protein